MTYKEAYNKAIFIAKTEKPAINITFFDITRRTFPKSNKEHETIERAITAAIQAERAAYLETHKRHVAALLGGASTTDCVCVFRESGGTSYLDLLQPI